MAAILSTIVVIIGSLIGLLFIELTPTFGITIWVLTALIAAYVAYAVRIADQWEKHVILRMGRYNGLRGPGLFFIIPVLDKVPYVIDLRTQVSTFDAKQTLTKDNVPVDFKGKFFPIPGKSAKS